MINLWLLLAGFVVAAIATNADPFAIPTIKGRLLTPEEGCGQSKVLTKRIVGGSVAKNGAYPWIALLGFWRPLTDSEGSIVAVKLAFSCGGSLITSKHVLSAAHCINNRLVLVRLGEYDKSTTTDGVHQDVAVNRAVKHTEFDRVHAINDIAIIHLARHVIFTDRIRPICLPIQGDILHRNFVGSNPFVAGWGLTSCSNFFQTPSSVLMQLQVPVIDMEQCEKEYRQAKANPDRQKTKDKEDATLIFDDHILCAGHVAGGKGVHYGDSGSPLMIPVHENRTFPYYQIGIVSGSEGCAEAGILDIYANVQFYANWIHENLK